ncbi:Uncharacterized protein HA466_0024860 [Hirschfeldia incana]|nr:Uncharacterized protein HA466_0024860 [Hirschfeldia incana]
MTSGGVQDEKNRSVATDYQHQQPPPHPPPFQGVSNYPPPQQQQQPPPPGYPQPAQPYVSGYAVNGVVEHDRLPCCGIGIGWLLFILGFFFGAIPWYIGFFLFLFSRNQRERPGYIACAIGAVFATIFIVLGATRGSGVW